MGDDRRAAALVSEALDLREQVTQGRATHVSVKNDLLDRAEAAVGMTANAELLLVIANLVQPYFRVDGRAKRIMNEARAKADRAGGATGALAESDRANRKLTQGSGCVILAATAVVGLLLAGARLADSPG